MWHFLAPQQLLKLPMVVLNGEIVAAAIVLSFGKNVHLEYTACLPDVFSLGANQLLIWEAIQAACRRGAEVFDFGRSALNNPTLIEFKERWNARAMSLRKLQWPESPQTFKHRPLQENARKFVEEINRHLPDRLLELEGRAVYARWH